APRGASGSCRSLREDAAGRAFGMPGPVHRIEGGVTSGSLALVLCSPVGFSEGLFKRRKSRDREACGVVSACGHDEVLDCASGVSAHKFRRRILDHVKLALGMEPGVAFVFPPL